MGVAVSRGLGRLEAGGLQADSYALAGEALETLGKTDVQIPATSLLREGFRVGHVLLQGRSSSAGFLVRSFGAGGTLGAYHVDMQALIKYGGEKGIRATAMSINLHKPLFVIAFQRLATLRQRDMDNNIFCYIVKYSSALIIF